MMSKNGLDNVLFVSKENLRPDATTPWGAFLPVIDGARIAMDILDVCDPTPDGYRCILVIADYFSKWTEAFLIKNKCADTVAGRLADGKVMYPPLFFYFYRTLPVVTPNCSLSISLHHPSESADRSFILLVFYWYVRL